MRTWLLLQTLLGCSGASVAPEPSGVDEYCMVEQSRMELDLTASVIFTVANHADAIEFSDLMERYCPTCRVDCMQLQRESLR